MSALFRRPVVQVLLGLLLIGVVLGWLFLRRPSLAAESTSAFPVVSTTSSNRINPELMARVEAFEADGWRLGALELRQLRFETDAGGRPLWRVGCIWQRS